MGRHVAHIIEIEATLASTSPPLRLQPWIEENDAVGGEHLPRPKLGPLDVCFTLSLLSVTGCKQGMG
jgi:hypothetical protein